MGQQGYVGRILQRPKWAIPVSGQTNTCAYFNKCHNCSNQAHLCSNNHHPFAELIQQCTSFAPTLQTIVSTS